MVLHFKFQTTNFQKGFTLLELTVVLAIFMLLVGTIISIFVSIVQQQKKILADQEMLGQVSYAQEYVSRAVRSAVRDEQGNCLTDGATNYPGGNYLLTHYNGSLGMYEGIIFLNKDSVCQEFYFDRNENTFKERQNGGAASNVISAKFPVKYTQFILNGDKTGFLSVSTDNIQPRISFAINIKNGSDTDATEKVFQTSISQRNLNTP